MSDEKPNPSNQPSPTTVPPAKQPQTGDGSPQQTSTPTTPIPPTEDPFALDRRLIGEIQKGGNAPERTAIQQPEFERNESPEKK